jgi:hypothetical protein
VIALPSVRTEGSGVSLRIRERGDGGSRCTANLGASLGADSVGSKTRDVNSTALTRSRVARVAESRIAAMSPACASVTISRMSFRFGVSGAFAWLVAE